MQRFSLLTLAIMVAPAGFSPAGETKLNGHVFTLPEGFTIELAAGSPLVERPIVAALDDEGRLYVADSSGSNDKVDQQLAEKPHRILRLTDTDGDGRFEQSLVFADKMMFPEGTLWRDGSLYVAAPPSIWKLTDTNGDGCADRREEWFKGKTLTGCANDLHGPYPGPDGWIYWCKGAFAQQTYARPGKKPFVTRAAHIFRCRADGTGLEPVMTGGMDNPVHVVFTPGGERIFTTTFLQHPGGGKRDGLIHAVYGGVYGKTHDVIEDHPRTGDVMPVMTHLGPAAPCGLVRYESPAFGPTYKDNLFACLFNLHKVTRHILEPDGATFKTRDEDFVVSTNLDFHPTDVVEDADGSLLIIDTGGWYKLCCPSSQLWKPDVRGAIYRVRRTGAPRPADPRGLKLAWSGMSPAVLAQLLADERPVVRQRALAALGACGPAAIPVLAALLRDDPSAEARRNALWALTRIDHADARAAVRTALADRDEIVRQVALHSISLWRDHAAVLQLADLLRAGSPHNRRAAAEALGRIGDPQAVPWLLAAAGSLATSGNQLADRFLEHSFTYALIEIAAPGPTATVAAGTDSAEAQRVRLLALDQMDVPPAQRGLQPLHYVHALDSPHPLIRETALWIVSRHRDWGDAVDGWLRRRLATTAPTAAERADFERLLARFAASPSVEALLAASLPQATLPADARQTVLKAMAQAGVRQIPKAWTHALAAVLAGGDRALVQQAVATARALPAPKEDATILARALMAVGRNPAIPADVRLEALAAVPGRLGPLEPALFDFLRAHLDAEQAAPLRAAATEALAKAKLAPDQLDRLIAALKTASPLDLDRLLTALAQAPDERRGQKLVAALRQSPALAGLHSDMLKHFEKFGPSVQQQAQDLYGLVNLDAAKQRQRLDELLVGISGGDIRRGQAVFHSAKANCSVCHAIGYVGGNIGPDLTRIGQIRTERDLLESIVFPSASFVRSYEPLVVLTKDGRVINGVVRKDAPDELVLATGPREEARIPRSEIEQTRPGTVSIMPSGLDQQLSRQDLIDLIAFLKAAR